MSFMVDDPDEPPSRPPRRVVSVFLSVLGERSAIAPLSPLPPPLKGFFQHPTGLRPTRARRDFITNLVAAAKSGRPTDIR